MNEKPFWLVELEKEMQRIQHGEILLTIRHGLPDRMRVIQTKQMTREKSV